MISFIKPQIYPTLCFILIKQISAYIHYFELVRNNISIKGPSATIKRKFYRSKGRYFCPILFIELYRIVIATCKIKLKKIFLETTALYIDSLI